MNPRIVPGRTNVRRSSWLVSALALAGMLLPSVGQAATLDIATVYSATYNGYTRAHLPDNSLRPETFCFAPGGKWDGTVTDPSIDNLPFMKIARTIAGPMKSQNYVTATDPNKTDLVIFVYWGTTTGAETGAYSNTAGAVRSAMDTITNFQGFNAPRRTAMALPPMAGTRGSNEPGGVSGSQGGVLASLRGEEDMAMLMLQTENEQRDMNNYRNARILGYSEALNNAMEIPWLSTSQDVVQELEMDRYFVVLRAYDFQQAWKHKHWKLLWETKYSIADRGNRFDANLANMTKTAAPYFGQKRGLVRELVPLGRVEVGTPNEVPQSVGK